VSTHLSIEETKKLSECVSDVRQTQQHERNADDSVSDAYDAAPERLRRYVPVACKHTCQNGLDSPGQNCSCILDLGLKTMASASVLALNIWPWPGLHHATFFDLVNTIKLPALLSQFYILTSA